MAKAKCIFQHTEAPPIINARLWSVEAPLVKYHLRGRGAYPYDCPSKSKHPNSYIYVSGSGGWIASHDLELQEDGSYIIR